MAQPKQYKVKKGYVWIGAEMKPTGAAIVTDADPYFAGQRHKVEPVEPDKPETKPKTKPPARAGSAPSNRLGRSGSRRVVKG